MGIKYQGAGNGNGGALNGASGGGAKLAGGTGKTPRPLPARGPDPKPELKAFLGSAADRLLELCRPTPSSVSPGELDGPRRGSDFRDQLQQSLGEILGLLGWDLSAEWLTETEQTRGFTIERVVQVPAAIDVGKPSLVTMTFNIPANARVMFKKIEVAPANCTAQERGESWIAETSEGEIPRPERYEGMLGINPLAGQIILPQSVLRENLGGMTLFMVNNDPFAVARFAVDIYGWTIER